MINVLICHTEIKSLMDLDRGYHASIEVRIEDCATCHSDHHGRSFDMARFDEENFDHDLAGYPLEGKHKIIDCRDCHKADFIDDDEIRKREETFLGLDTECISCHDDYHQGTLSNDCASCHDIEAFRPAPYFDHDETDYALLGQHRTVDCIECHQLTYTQWQRIPGVQ